MQRAKEVESAELNKKFNSITLTLKPALWMKLPPQVILIEDSVKPKNVKFWWPETKCCNSRPRKKGSGFSTSWKECLGTYQRTRPQELQRSRPKERSRSNTEGSTMYEPAQQKKDSPMNGQLTTRYSAIIHQHEHSNNSNSNSNTDLSSGIVCYIADIMPYSNQLNSIENSLNIFQYESMDLNKLWLKYFCVVNLSDHKCSFLELSVLGKGLKFCPTPPKYCHRKLKESIDKFFQSASLKVYFEPSGPEDPESILESSFL